MNFHGNNDNKNGNGKGNSHKGHLSHMLMMALCCGAPILILLIVPFLAKNGGAGMAKVLAGIAPFLCPLMMLFMIPMMFRGKKDNADKNECHPNKQLKLDEKTQEE